QFSVLYPALFEIQVRFPNRYFINKEAWSRFLGTWHALIGSQTLARRSSARYRKGREIRLNGICGVIFKEPESMFRFGFFRCSVEELNREAANVSSSSLDRFTASTVHRTLKIRRLGGQSLPTNARTSCPRRWPNFRGRIIRRYRHACRQSMFQHFHDRLSGSADRPFLSWTNRGDDLPAHWKLRHQFD